jgi:hypothetical protein
MDVELNNDQKILTVQQQIMYHNQSNDTLQSITLNDWNNAYSTKDTPLARRFSDEYVRAFHLAGDEERGSTSITNLTGNNGIALSWKRPEDHPDIIDIQLSESLYPNQKFTITISYTVKVPSDRFTRYGFDNKGNYNLKYWYLTPARYEDHGFVKYSNENIDDIANANCNYEVILRVPLGMGVATDLVKNNQSVKGAYNEFSFTGINYMDFTLVLENKNTFETYSNNIAEITTNLKDDRVTDIQEALLIDKIMRFTADNLGTYPNTRIMITQVEYDRHPVYGLMQLPGWLNAVLSPYPDSFLYEVRFLKTYLNTYLHNTLKIDPRKDNWIYDGIQMYLMLKYIEENHPDKTMMGLRWGILRGHNLFNVSFNGQYNYMYLLMARKNLDQPIGDAKNTLIKFNEQIAGKYRAGLSLNYLDDYLGNSIVDKSIKEFLAYDKENQVTRADFRSILESNTDKDINWFFDTVVATRDIIDYKIGKVDKDGEQLNVTVKNRTGTTVPVSLYGLKDGNVIFKQWLENIKTDSTFIIEEQGAEKLVLNYNGEIPEYNARNNWKSMHKLFLNNRPIKFTFFQDLEDPHYNQIFYVPSFTYNLYDGVSVGLRFHNKSLLEKPFIFDVEPTYSSNTGSLIGSASFAVNRFVRDEGSLYNIRYAVGGSTYHYAPDAAYVKFTPSISFRFRDEDFRKNSKQSLFFRYVLVNRERSAFTKTVEQNENYGVFNARYGASEAEITRVRSFSTDVQLANNFGKLAGETQFRRLFNDNRQINLRVYAGMFMYRSTNSEFYNFGLDRPNDYLFDYNFYGRSETTGLYSQQYIMAEGGFKSKLDTRYANQWMTTINGSFNIWNWIEIYGDAGLFKNKYRSAKFVYDSGIRLNLVPDYFELYFPVYSSNGFELNDGNYSQKIRFVVTLSPGTLINLFTRKWL